jgi:hypothetical protein
LPQGKSDTFSVLVCLRRAFRPRHARLEEEKAKCQDDQREADANNRSEAMTPTIHFEPPGNAA